MSGGYQWNNRFNPPLQTASARFPKRVHETPQTPANHTTHQMLGAPPPHIYTNQITPIPPVTLSIVSVDSTDLSVTLNVGFAYAMQATDHMEFTFTNLNTGVQTVKSSMQVGSGNYTIGVFDPGVQYSVFVTPVVNSISTAASATLTFISSTETAPGIIQGLTLTGSGSYAIISFTGVYPSAPFPQLAAVDNNFGDQQVLIPLNNQYTFATGPYTDGLSYQFQITPVTVGGTIYRYGTTTGVPTGNNYFIPGPPAQPQILSTTANNTTVTICASVDVSTHPMPDYYQIGYNGTSVNVSVLQTTVGNVTFSGTFVQPVFIISNVTTTQRTVFSICAHANRVFGPVSQTSIWAGYPYPPNLTSNLGNQTVRMTGTANTGGPTPTYYQFSLGTTTLSSTTGVVTFSAGITNGTQYQVYGYGYANGGLGLGSSVYATPNVVAPTSLSVTNINNLTASLSVGRPLGGAFYYFVMALSGNVMAAQTNFNDSESPGGTIAVGSPGLYTFVAYSQKVNYGPPPSTDPALLATTGPYYLGSPGRPTNVKGVYLGTPANVGLSDISARSVNLTLTASWGGGVPVDSYTITVSQGGTTQNVSAPSSLPSYDLIYNFPTLSAYTQYSFTVTPVGNSLAGTPAAPLNFDFNPQPPSAADLYMTGTNDYTLNVSYGGPSFEYGNATDFYVIRKMQGDSAIADYTAIRESGSQAYSQDAKGVYYQFRVYTTICGIISLGYAQTQKIAGGPPLAPNVQYTLGNSQVNFTFSINSLNIVVISNYKITEYYQSNGGAGFIPTGAEYTIAVTPGIQPDQVSYTVSSVVTLSSTSVIAAGSWNEAAQTTPSFSVFDPFQNSLNDNTYSNLVTLTVSQEPLPPLTFPVTSFVLNVNGTGSNVYATDLISKQTTVFNSASDATFIWSSGTGPFFGGTYRYDIVSVGSNVESTTASTTGQINMNVGSPGQPSVSANNTTVTVTFSSPPSATVVPSYYIVTDNYGNSVTGSTTLSDYVFTGTTTGSGYTYTVTAYAQGLSSAPSIPSATIYPGTPGAPTFQNFQTSFGNNGTTARATLSTLVSSPIPITDICLSIKGDGTTPVVTRTNLSSSYLVGSNGPTFVITNLAIGATYTFTICAYANMVYSPSYSESYYTGSLPPPNSGTVALDNLTATVSLSPAVPLSAKPETISPDSYVFLATRLNNGNVTTITQAYVTGQTTVSATFGPLADVCDYTFSGYTVTNSISYGGGWNNPTVYNMGGPRPSFSVLPSLPGGTPSTSGEVQLQVTILETLGSWNQTLYSTATGLWADTSYYVKVGSGGTYSLISASASYITTVSAGNTYVAYAYGVKNQVTGQTLSNTLVVPPCPPQNPLIILNPTPDVDISLGATIPANITWVQSATANVTYYYAVGGNPYVDNTSPAATITIPYNLSYRTAEYTLSVYSFINGISSAVLQSPAVYAFTNPPTNLTYSRLSTNVTLSWGTAFQPGYPQNIVYTATSTVNGNANGINIGSTQGAGVIVGINIMPVAVYSQIKAAFDLGRPLVVTLSSSSPDPAYYQSFPVSSYETYTFGSVPAGYRFRNNGSPALPNYTGSNIQFSITNPSALPSGGYILHDLCSGATVASGIYTNNYVWTTGITGNTYNIAVQAFNANMYSLAVSASTGPFKLGTSGAQRLAVTYFGTSITLGWTTPIQTDGNTTPVSWTLTELNGYIPSITGSSPTNQITNITGTLNLSYAFSVVFTYYGIPSTALLGNVVTLSTTPVPSVTQTTSGAGVIVSWQTASQTVYLPSDTQPIPISVVSPNGGYSIKDLCGNYANPVIAGSADVSSYISGLPLNKFYNFAVTAIHNGISSSAVASVSGAVYLGVNPPTNLAVTQTGMVATLTWTAATTYGPNISYAIYDLNGNFFGDPGTQGVQDVTFSVSGIYSITTLVGETVSVKVTGAGSSICGGGVEVYSAFVGAGNTIVATVGGKAGQTTPASNTAIYIPGNQIIDAGGGGGSTLSGLGFVRGGIPDGGSPNSPGSGSGGVTLAGVYGQPNSDGIASLSLTYQAFKQSISIGKAATSAVVTLRNNSTYRFSIVSYSNGLSSAANFAQITTRVIAPTTPFTTTFSGLFLSNAWNVQSTPQPNYFLTNLTTGDCNIVGTTNNSLFTPAGTLNTTYQFSVYALSNGIPSSVLVGTALKLYCPPPTNFKLDYYGCNISFTASGTSEFYETFVITDLSGNPVRSALVPQGEINLGGFVVAKPPGATYTFQMYGLLNGLQSTIVTASTNLVIPGTTTLGSNPVIGGLDTTTQTYPITVYQCTPSADSFLVTPTNLNTSLYYSTPSGNWVSVAMSVSGTIMLAASTNTSGRALYVSSNTGIGWAVDTTTSLSNVSVKSVALAAAGTWGAAVTPCGLWVTPNVVNTPFTYVSNTSTCNIVAAAFSPDAAATTMLVGVSGGGIYTIPTNQLLVNPLFSTTQGSGNHYWTSIAWSGDGSTVFACGSDTMQPIYSTTGGTFWSNISVLPTIPGWASVSPNSNGYYALFGAPRARLPTITTGPVGSWTASTTGVINANITDGNPTTCASSQTGDIQIAVLSNGVYSSYDYGSTWVQVGGGQTTEFKSTDFKCAAVSSNGFVETVLGFNSSLAVKVGIPSGTTTASTIPIALNAASASSNVGGNNSTGFSVVPSLKGISGAGVFGWRTPTVAPVLFPQLNNGQYSTVVNDYKSGWGYSSGNLLSAYFLFDTRYPIPVTASSYYGPPNGASLGMVYTPGNKYDTYFISNAAGYDLTPGTYTLSLAFASGAQTYTVYVPLNPPTNVTAVGNNGSNIIVNWSKNIPDVNVVRSYTVYCNAVAVATTNQYTQTIANTGSSTINIYVTASANGITSVSAAAATLFAPAAPTGLSVTQWSGATDADKNGNLPIQLSWNTVTGLNYYALSSLGDAYTSPIGANVNSPAVGSSLTYTLWAYSNTATFGTTTLFSASAKITITSTATSKIYTSGAFSQYSIPGLSILKSIELLGGGGNGGTGKSTALLGGIGGGGGGGGGYLKITNITGKYSTTDQQWDGGIGTSGGSSTYVNAREPDVNNFPAFTLAGDAKRGLDGVSYPTTLTNGSGGVASGNVTGWVYSAVNGKPGVFGGVGVGGGGKGGDSGGGGSGGVGGTSDSQTGSDGQMGAGGGGGYADRSSSGAGGNGGSAKITFAYNQITYTTA